MDINNFLNSEVNQHNLQENKLGMKSGHSSFKKNGYKLNKKWNTFLSNDLAKAYDMCKGDIISSGPMNASAEMVSKLCVEIKIALPLL